MYGKCEFGEWAKVCEECKVDQADLLFLVFRYWLHKPLSITMVREMLNLYKIIKTVLLVCRNEGGGIHLISQSLINSEFECILNLYHLTGTKTDWRKVRFQLANSECPLTAITAAIVCRAISAKIQNHQIHGNLWNFCLNFTYPLYCIIKTCISFDRSKYGWKQF